MVGGEEGEDGGACVRVCEAVDALREGGTHEGGALAVCVYGVGPGGGEEGGPDGGGARALIKVGFCEEELNDDYEADDLRAVLA